MTVHFDGRLSTGNDGAAILQYVLSSGAGPVTRTPDLQLEYTYNSPGYYPVELEVWDSTGATATVRQGISVSDGTKEPPQVHLIADTLEGSAPLAVQLLGECTDSAGTIESRVWQVGERTFEDGRDSLRVVFELPGSYRVRLTVTDSNGLTGYDQATIAVKLQDKWPPQVRIIATTLDTSAPAMVELRADAKDADGVVESVQWTLPDGHTSTESKVVVKMVDAGYYTSTLKAIDNDGLTGVDVWTLAVRSNDLLPPRIVSSPTTSATVGEPYSYDWDNKAAAQGSRVLVWSLGKMLDGRLVNAPSDMSINAKDGVVVWRPSPAQAGQQQVTIVARNDVGISVQDYVINVAPAPATALGTTVYGMGCACDGQTTHDAGAALPLVAALLLLAIVRSARTSGL